MQPLHDLREMRILLADREPGRIQAMRKVLSDASFGRLEAIDSLEGLLTVLRDTFRFPERAPAIVLLSDSLMRPDDTEGCQSLCALAEEAHLPVVLVHSQQEPLDSQSLLRLRAAGVLDVVSWPQPGNDLPHRMLLFLSIKQERDLRRQREMDLEAELAERRVMETRLQHMAYHDELTGLWNRRRLKQALEISVMHAASFGQACAVLLIDLDRFKLVNDLEGYDAGDRMLMEVSRVVRGSAAPQDTVARIGSDEFAILFNNCAERDAVERAEKLRSELDAYRFRYGSRAYRACASVGIATVPGGAEGLNEAEVLARADQACYVAKQHGRNQVHLYRETDPELEHLRTDFRWAPRIREALEKDLFFFHYQPVVRVMDGEITHYELLLRMHGQGGEVHLPGRFIPVAERTGLIHQVDLWVVDRAIDFLASLPAEQSRLCVSVNLSGYAFKNDALFSLLARKLELSWVSPTRLVFEITETAAIDNLDQSREMVARLRALGCRFALDDFGSGFSTFNYLKHFPVDYLKLDGSFIVNMAQDPTDQELVRHMISIAHSLGKKTIAEFVENPETYRMLRRFGVDYVQGHYLGRAEKTLTSLEKLPGEVTRGVKDQLGLLDEPPAADHFKGARNRTSAIKAPD